MKTSMFDMVREFHTTFNQAIDQPLSSDLLILRSSLIAEEVAEVIEDEVKLLDDEGDIQNFTKELADLMYVVIGTAVTFGLPLEEVFAEVHKSNMSKVGDDGKAIFREDGKVLKGPNYQPPNLEKYFD